MNAVVKNANLRAFGLDFRVKKSALITIKKMAELLFWKE